MVFKFQFLKEKAWMEIQLLYVSAVYSLLTTNVPQANAVSTYSYFLCYVTHTHTEKKHVCVVSQNNGWAWRMQKKESRGRESSSAALYLY